MGNQRCALHSPIAFVPPRKLRHAPAYPTNPTHGDISATNRQYQDNRRDYHLVKNMTSALNKISIAYIDEKCIKGWKYMVIGYANKYIVELMNCIYVRYG